MNPPDEPRGFDFHCHIDLDRNPAALIERCERERIWTLGVTTTPKAWRQNQRWMERSRFVFPALGLHPELAAERHEEIAILEAEMHGARFIGEVGLDGSPRFRSSAPIQQEVFGRVLETADRLGGRVLTIHSRRAAREVVSMIRQHARRDRVLCILHWFTGTPAEAKLAAAEGCWFSVNGQMLAQERGQNLVRSLPLDRLLTETDSPFSKEGSNASLPWDVLRTVDRLAATRSLTIDGLIETLHDNARRVLQFAGLSHP